MLSEGDEPELHIEQDSRLCTFSKNAGSLNNNIIDRYEADTENNQLISQTDRIPKSQQQTTLETDFNQQDEEVEEEQENENDENDEDYLDIFNHGPKDRSIIINTNKKRKNRKTSFRLTKPKGSQKQRKKTYQYSNSTANQLYYRQSLSQPSPTLILNTQDNQQKDSDCRTTIFESQTTSNVKLEDHEELKKTTHELITATYQYREHSLDKIQQSLLSIYKGRLLLISLDQNNQVQQIYRLLKGDYFKCEQFALIRVLTEVPRFFQIGWSKKYRIREITGLRITGLRDEHNLEELEGETCVVGRLKSSRLSYTFQVRQNQVFIIGGYEEYKRKFTKKIEVITADQAKGSPLKITDDFPELKVGRICPSSIILGDRYLYVMFGKAKKGRGEMFQTDIEQLDLHRVGLGAQFNTIKIQSNMSIIIQFFNAIALDYHQNSQDILLVGGLQSIKDNINLPQCYKVTINMQGNNSKGIAYIEKVKMGQKSYQQMESFQSNMQNFMKIQDTGRTSLINNDGTMFRMSQNSEGRMVFDLTDRIKNYIDQLTV
ncbi:UNKNOWN [Stylonychia lemnae]|uniref:Kelch motif family protein n=1 Tax=Stylonychia lemnae TaxID=5949 RepID=A0A078B0I8_STYLE|nr:UNKNOWN [Stylonychia lemnae]|eukprot:CDW87826.1 UNKNOWN [Stylonychia lemnae]